jgi:UDP:flavonoid glycosyltransferase YjiC (YdhE family)/uncharacterized protein (DUF2141 family)
MQRVLFVSENITLAQVVRLLALAEKLPSEKYEVHFACSDSDNWIFCGTTFRRHSLLTVDGPKTLAALARGERLYGKRTLERYVADDLRVINEVRPDVIIGDFRLSLAVSARRVGVPCASLINAYWSPFAQRGGFPLPDHPLVRLFGPKLAEQYFPKALPHVFDYFAAPLNAVRQSSGLEASSLLEQLCFGDTVLYPDIPELCPLTSAPKTHHFLGAVPWAPKLPVPADLPEEDAKKPLVYVTLGSSGDRSALPAVLEGMADLPLQGVLATAGRKPPSKLPSNFKAFDYLPGDVLARRARFVVTNGGSSTGYQALAAGAPVLGVASNLDQYLAMDAITRAGAGLLVRAGGLKSREVRAAATRLLEDTTLRDGARKVEKQFAGYDCHQRFQTWLGALAACVMLLLSPASTFAEEDTTLNTIEFETQTRNDAGVVRCGLFKESGWLTQTFRASIVDIHGKRALCTFKDVPAGTYGISAFHDEDKDGKLDTNLVGYPVEEYCASNNARNLMSAPSWKDAKFGYRGGTRRLKAVMK